MFFFKKTLLIYPSSIKQLFKEFFFLKQRNSTYPHLASLPLPPSPSTYAILHSSRFIFANLLLPCANDEVREGVKNHKNLVVIKANGSNLLVSQDILTAMGFVSASFYIFILSFLNFLDILKFFLGEVNPRFSTKSTHFINRLKYEWNCLG